MNKKGIMLGEAFGAVLTLVLIGVLVIISVYIFVIMQGASPLESVSVYNESKSMTGPLVTVLSNSTACGFQSLSIISVYNTTNNILINSGNYTVNGTGIANTTGTYPTAWLINYNYRWNGQGCVASQSLVTQFATFPALIGLVGTIIFLSLVIGVLVTSFMFNKKGA